MKPKPNLSFWKLWNLSFGFFGVTNCVRPARALTSRASSPRLVLTRIASAISGYCRRSWASSCSQSSAR